MDLAVVQKIKKNKAQGEGADLLIFIRKNGTEPN